MRAVLRSRAPECMLGALLLLAACSSDGTGEPRGTPLPAELSGQWQAVLAYVPAYWEGVIPTADFDGSLGVFLSLLPDGRYQLDLRSALAYFGGNCFRTTLRTEYGAVTLAGADVTCHPARATHSVLDSCGETSFGEIDPGDPWTVVLAREQDQTGWPLLRLGLASGEELLLERCRDCE